MRALGLEPRTYGLKGREPGAEPLAKQPVTNTDANACTNACTESRDSCYETRADACAETSLSDDKGGARPAQNGGDSGPTGDAFAEAVVMLVRLPLSNAERAEAVRRLLNNSMH